MVTCSSLVLSVGYHKVVALKLSTISRCKASFDLVLEVCPSVVEST